MTYWPHSNPEPRQHTPTARSCPRHGQPIPTTANLCGACTRQLDRDLGDIPALTHDLTLTMARVRAVTYDRALGADSRLVFDETASRALAALRVTVVALVRDLVDDRYADREGPRCRGCNHPSCVNYRPNDTVDAMTLWLLHRRQQLHNHPAALDITSNVHAAVVASRKALDRGHDDRCYLGRCGADPGPDPATGTERPPCTADLYAAPDAPTVTCRACTTVWDVAELRRWLLLAAEDTLATATEIGRAAPALGVDVTPKAIWHYEARGRVSSRGLDVMGRRLYRVGDVIDVAREVAARRTSSSGSREVRSA